MYDTTVKTILEISFITIIATAISLAADSTSPDLREYVCTNRFFELPESFDKSNVEKCRLLVKANPNRFEPHVQLAAALGRAGSLEEAVEEFRAVDELSSKVSDREVLSRASYEDIYAFTLFAAAQKRFKQRANELYTMRMLQQAIAMAPSALREKKHLAQCYAMLGGIYLNRGLYDKAIEVSETGIKTATLEGHADFIPLFEQITVKAKEFKNPRPN
jgi:tetratricopeptide (TPR) repeat protein